MAIRAYVKQVIKKPVQISKSYGSGKNVKITTITVEKEQVASYLVRGFTVN